MRQLVTSVLTWWRAELVGLVPASIRALLSGQPRPLIVDFDPDLAEPARQGRTVTLPEPAPFSADAFLEAVRFLRTWARRPIVVRLPQSGYLRRRVEIPERARRQAEQIADLDLARSLPFERDEIVWRNLAIREGRATSVEQLILRKQDLEIAERTAGAASAELLRVEVPGNGDRQPVVLVDRAREVGRHWRWWRRLEAAALLVGASAAAYAFVAPDFERRDHHQQLGQRLVLVQKKARKLREVLSAREAELARAGAFRQALAARVPVSVMLAEITARLPDATWLDGLTLDGTSLVVSGRSKAPVGGVIDDLAGAEAFSSVRLTGAISIDPQSGLQRFQAIAAVAAPD